MHYALTPRTFLFSHYFYTGLRIATGVVGLALLTLSFSNLPAAMVVATGALCTSLMDLPSPFRHKFTEMLASVLLCSTVALIVSLCSPVRWLLGAVIVPLSFFASMMVVYGRKAMPLQFAALFIMSLSARAEISAHESIMHTALFFAGGMAYLLYAMVVAWLLRSRIKQQVLAEALYELARYTIIKAGCYDVSKDLDKQLEKLVRQQIRLAEKQQASRDLILRGRQSARDANLVQVHYAMFDLYELVLSTHTDYTVLREHFAQTPLLPLLRKLIAKAARDIEAVAYALTRNRTSAGAMDFSTELEAVERQLAKAAAASVPTDACLAARAAYRRIQAVAIMIGKLHAATLSRAAPSQVVSGTDMTPFLTRQRYGLRVLLSHMRWSSPIFRYALRVAMAMSTGLAMAEFLPYSAHGYWIALTIAVILKPSFSMTKQRRADRVIGTLIGCILTTLILRFVHSPIALSGFLFLATAAGPTFLNIKYRYTAVAASMQILLLIGMTVPGSHHPVIERLLDTLIGAAIASFFSYVLPSWEYQDLPRLISNVLAASRQFVDTSRDLLQERVTDDFRYRISRKRFMDSLANLSAALVRMLDEPPDKHHAVADINRFTVRNYLLVAHFAGIRLLLQRNREGLPREAVNMMVEQICRQAQRTLAQAQSKLKAAPTLVYSEMEDIVPEPVSSWPGWAPLQRRARLLRQDAEEIEVASQAISLALGLVKKIP